MPIEPAISGQAMLVPGESFEIRVPGSIANLGPGFDAVAVAVQLYLTLSVRVLPGFGELHFSFQGDAPDGNKIARAFHRLQEQHPGPLPSLAVAVHSEIPMRAGLGSSAAATIAGLKLFAAAAQQPLLRDELLTAASALEGHPDNVAAALLGGLALSWERADGTVSAVTMRWPADIRLLVLTPEVELATDAAREVLPDTLSRRDAVSNLQHLALLLWALANGSFAYLREAMADRLHQPYRQSLVPGLTGLLELQHPDLLGVCLSGAGPSLVALVPAGGTSSARIALETMYRRTGLRFTTRELIAHPAP